MTETRRLNNFVLFKLMLWKNFCILSNMKWSVLLTLSLSLIAILILIPMKMLMHIEIPGIIMHDPQSLATLKSDFEENMRQINIRRTILTEKVPDFNSSVFIPQLVFAFYSVNEDSYDGFAAFVAHTYPSGIMQVKKFRSCEEVQSEMVKHNYFAGICVERERPKLRFTIVMPDELRVLDFANFFQEWKVPETWMRSLRKRYRSQMKSIHEYEGVLTIQLLVVQFYTMDQGGEDIDKFFASKELPNMHHKDDTLTTECSQSVIYIAIFALFFPNVLIFQAMTDEKQSLLWDYLRAKQINPLLQSLSWLTVSFLISALLSVFICFVFKIQWKDEALFRETHGLIFYTTLLLYSLANSIFCVLISSFVKAKGYATFFYLLIWLLFLMPCELERYSYEPTVLSIHATTYIFTFIFHNYMFAKLIFFYLAREDFKEKHGWLAWLSQLQTEDTKLSLFIFIDVLIYMSILFIKEKKIVETWFRKRKQTNLELNSQEFWLNRYQQFYSVGRESVSTIDTLSSIPQKRSTRLKLAIETMDMSYHIQNKKLISQVNLEILENDIVAVLGANASGKTTLCKLLSGLIKPTNGKIYIDGYDLSTQMAEGLFQVGFCLGNNFLVDGLTVLQQVKFHLGLKDTMNSIDNYRSSLELCQDMQLDRFFSKVTRDLSITLQNMLAIVCAMCGNSKIVVLDAFDIDMDTKSEKTFLEFIEKNKCNRTIIFSTIYVKYAENLANRVIILSDGAISLNGPLRDLFEKQKLYYYVDLYKMPTFNLDQINRLKVILEEYFYGKATILAPVYKGTITVALPMDLADEITSFLQMIEENMEDFDLKCIEVKQRFIKRYLIDLIEEYGTAGDEDDPSNLIKDFVSSPKANHNNSKLDVELSPMQCFFQRMKAYHMMHIWYNLPLPYLLSFYIGIPCTFTFLLLLSVHLAIEPFPKNANMYHSLEKNSFCFLLNVRNPDLIPKADRLLANTFWYYREDLITTRKQCVFNIHGEPLADFLTQNISYALLNKLNGGLEKDYSIQSPYEKPRFTFIYNAFHFESMSMNLMLLLQAYMRALGGSEHEIEHQILILDEQHKFLNDESYLQYICFCFSLIIVITMQFRLFRFVTNNKNSESTTEMINFGLGKEFWLTTVSFTAMQALIIVIIYLISSTTELFQLNQLNINCSISIIIILCSFYARYYRVLILCLVKDEYVSNIYQIFSVFLGFLYFSLSHIHKDFSIEVFLVSSLAPLALTYYCINFLISNAIERFMCASTNLYQASVYVAKCSSAPNCCVSNRMRTVYELSTIGLMVLMNFLLFGFLYLKENWIEVSEKCSKQIRKICLRKHYPLSEHSSDDVHEVNEHHIGLQDMTEGREPAIVVQNLSKIVRGHHVIKDINITFYKNDLFAILGPLKSGTSMFMRLLARKERQTSGTISIYGKSENYITPNLVNIAYVPCFPNIRLNCTIYEYIKNQALLCNVHPDKVERLVIDLARKFNLIGLLDTNMCNCSLGTERRICILIAFLGDPKIILLNGALKGIDIVGFFHIFNLLRSFSKSGGTLICSASNKEYLTNRTDRLGIFDHGHFLAVSSIQTFNKDFVSGYLLDTCLAPFKSQEEYREKTLEKLQLVLYNKYLNFIETNFEIFFERTDSDRKISHFFPKGSTTMGDIFRKIVNNSKRLNVYQFQITTNTAMHIYEDLHYETQYAKFSKGNLLQ